MSDETTTTERRRNDQAIPSIASWTPPWEGSVNQPRPVERYERQLAQQET